MVLNTGAYSNTGGQTSTASFTAQDSDLSRIGKAHSGKQEDRKELGLIAAFHPNVFVVQSAAAMQGHFLKYAVEYLNYSDGPAVLDVYTPCQPEHGISDDAASKHGRLAVESRMWPDVRPRSAPRPPTASRSSSSTATQTRTRIGSTARCPTWTRRARSKLLQLPLTPADFAYAEGRFKKHFKRLAEGADGVPVHEYIDLGAAAREGKTPFVWSTDDAKHAGEDRRLG